MRFNFDSANNIIGQRLAWRFEIKTIIVFISVIGSIASIYAVGGWKSLAITCALLLLCSICLQLFRMSRRIRELEKRLVAELPHHHKFLVEFLRTTYIARGQDRIVERNRGLTVYSYENNFAVKGTDCSNSQVIKGRNVSNQHVRGISFALVGGSSMNIETLHSRYATHDGASGVPEFLIDDDRFKIAFCTFKTPLAPSSQFSTTYSDEWKGAMRPEADGFFFPEALYFPDKISELSVRLDFDFEVKTLASLEVDMDLASVRMCDEQPNAVEAASGYSCAFSWKKYALSPQAIYVLYYTA